MLKNPFTRRGMLGAVIGRHSWEAGRPANMEARVAALDPSWEEKSKRFHDLMAPYQRADMRRQLARNIMGNLPPSVASNHSWAPWFRAQAAARQIEQEDWDRRGFMDKLHAELHRKVFGA